MDASLTEPLSATNRRESDVQCATLGFALHKQGELDCGYLLDRTDTSRSSKLSA